MKRPAAAGAGIRTGEAASTGLCAGKTFEFTSMGEATLKGFNEPVTLYEVRAS